MSNFLPELEQDPFDPDEFVERLAWRATAGKFDPEAFDPDLLHDAFESGIKDLKNIYEVHEKKCERLETICKEEEKKHWIRVAELQERCKDSTASFGELDSSLDTVAARVVYLGDQLEGVNLPRSRAVEAQKLMKSFADFVSPGPINSPLMTEPSQLYEEADVISKLQIISQELPPLTKFDRAKEKINIKYDQIERELIEEFVAAQSRSDPDKIKMKEIANIMSHFKGYSQCIDAFIEQSQSCIYLTPNLFLDIVPICLKSQLLVEEVFSNPDQVMAKFVLNIYHGKVQEFVQSKLNHFLDRTSATGSTVGVQVSSETDKYLTELQDLYSKTNKLSHQLAESNILGIDINFLNKLTRVIFSRHLDMYIDIESRCLKDKCSLILNRYYESKNHVKKNITSTMGGIYDLKRDLQAKIGRANINIANINISVNNININEQIMNGKETFLSEEVAINILQETKLALIRCHLLSKPVELAKNASDILDVQLHFLVSEHIDYAVELGFQALPSNEPKSAPEIHFFETVRQSNAVCHLLEKQFVDAVLPVVISTPKHGECIKKKKDAFEAIEIKLNNGLEKCINAIIGWIKLILFKEQKKADFSPETDDADMTQTVACSKVVRFMSSYIERIKDTLDGKNVEALLAELGTRFHRTIYEHLLQFSINSVGAMIVICDVNEYRRCASECRINIINNLFDTLHDLCNLLVVAPENLKQVCAGDQLSGLDKSVLMSFVQLRSDFKTAKLINQFK